MSQNSIASQLAPVFLSILGEDHGLRILFWDGSSIGSDDAKATAVFRSPEAVRHVLWAPGELGLARAYITSAIDFEGDLFHALTGLTKIQPRVGDVGLRTLGDTVRAMRSLGVLGRRPQIPEEEMRAKGRLHSKRRDAAAIAHHYDVGNDFYRLFLGSTMTYSCARFVDWEDSLDTAQVAKYDMICRKLGLGPGDRLLDVGCGWGGLLRHAATNYGAHGVGITLSKEQAIYAQEKNGEAGVGDKIQIRVQDYRELGGESFDAISSVGMFEHVGRSQMATYFSTLASVLRPAGRLLNHAIDSTGGSAMAPNGFIARYVFPDGELQDLSVSLGAMQDAGFEVRDVESLREHYAATLRHWVANLDENWEESVRLVGINRSRVWRIYMAGSAVSFETNRISIHQSLGVKTPANGQSEMPSTRRSFV